MPSLSNDFGTLRTNQYQVKDLLYNNIEINTTGATSSGVGTVYPYTSQLNQSDSIFSLCL
jgi:hypothetical protein